MIQLLEAVELGVESKDGGVVLHTVRKFGIFELGYRPAVRLAP